MKKSLLHSLWHLHLITPRGIVRLLSCFLHEGITLMAVVRFAVCYHAHHCAVVSDNRHVDYQEFYALAQRLSRLLYHNYHLESGQHVALFCRNHLVSALLLPALSRLGVHVKLLNTDLSDEQLAQVMGRSFALFIYDEELTQANNLYAMCSMVSCEKLLESIETHNFVCNTTLPHIKRGGNISVMTGGSSGKYKEAARQTGIVQFLPPFFSLLCDLHIDSYRSVLIGLPFYHGFGLATLLVSFVMGKTVCLLRRFDAEEVLNVVATEHIEVMPMVPAMLARLWQVECAESRLRSLKCIISGGDRLDVSLAKHTIEHIGPVLYNLYGTSEAGFFMLATPQQLIYNGEVSIGKPIRGMQCEVRDADAEGVGTLWVKCKWAMVGRQNCWQSTGDRVLQLPDGRFLHRGRADRMVVCGGENVYPEHVEQVLKEHALIVDSVVYAVSDVRFGCVLSAQIELKAGALLAEDDLKEWLRARLSRAEMPHHFRFGSIGMLSTGKHCRNI
ncbi:class I adenylate-forming enzyme family protein [Prevotella pallens]|uniref:AMP-dependent synthetase and ligase n=2 Tax=Prevotella pallens TaxID=60133 RepID=F9DJV6_9BACT|nr:AMP-binding protein [Prevotella pallens]EGQ15529.1 AMP-dependent synthetase and ligase [Prevotella pallens ATCC 700821]RAS47455.1 acyl-CoA synthetase (AMP-forming)/AMP-acid ligase II [Prevotella pallens]